MPRLSIRGWTLAASGMSLLVIGLFTGRRELLFLGALALALTLVALAAVQLWRLKFSVTRELTPPIVAAGETVTVRLSLRNLSAWPGSGASWREETPVECAAPQRTELAALGVAGSRGDRVTLQYQLTPHRRGIVPIGPVHLGRSDPFGLAQAKYPTGRISELVVTPRVTQLPRSAAGIQVADGVARPQLRHRNPNSDELIAREYRPGDSMRRVHWPATARRGEIMVRQEEQRSKPEASLVIDTAADWRAGDTLGEPAGDRTSRYAAAFETAIECAASIGVHLIDSGFQVEVIETVHPQLGLGRSTHYRSPGGDHALLEDLAGIHQLNAAGNRDHAGMVHFGGASAGSSGARAPLFAVLIDPDAEACAALARLRTTGGPAFAIVQDTLSMVARDALEHAGWRLVVLRGPRHIAECWLELRSMVNHA